MQMESEYRMKEEVRILWDAQHLATINNNLKRIALQPVLRPSGLINAARDRSEGDEDDQEETERDVRESK